MVMRRWLSNWWLEIFIVGIIVFWGTMWSRSGQVSIPDDSLRIASNTLVLGTISTGITAVSILFPVTIAIYFTLQQKGLEPEVVKRFFRASCLYLISLIFAIWGM